MSKPLPEAGTYQIRIRGLLKDQVLEAIGGDAPLEPSTSFLVTVQDRAALHSVIRRIEDLALDLISVTPVNREAQR